MTATLRQLLPESRELESGEAYARLGLSDLAPADRPYLVANMVASVDGNATLGGKSSGISNELDRELFHTLRTQADAVMAGTNTIEKENYGALVRDPKRREQRVALGLEPAPVAVTINRSLELPLGAPLFTDPDSRIFVITNSEAEPPDCPAEIVTVCTPGEAIDFGLALTRLRTEHGIRSILLEGGPTLLGVIVAAGLLDELFLTISPLLAGGGPGPTIVEGPALPEPAGLGLKSAMAGEGSLFLRYGVERG